MGLLGWNCGTLEGEIPKWYREYLVVCACEHGVDEYDEFYNRDYWDGASVFVRAGVMLDVLEERYINADSQ